MNFMKNKRSKLYVIPGTPTTPPVCVLSGFWCFCVNKLLYCFVLYCTILYCDRLLKGRYPSDRFPGETKTNTFK